MNTLTTANFSQLVETAPASTLTLCQQDTTYLSVVSSFTDLLEFQLEFQECQSSSDSTTAVVDFFIAFNEKCAELDNDAVIYWLKRFHASSSTIKSAVTAALVESSSNFYQEVSDSIGGLTNTAALLNDTVIPLNDLECVDIPAPVAYPLTVQAKLSQRTRDLVEELSTSTTRLYRGNTINIQGEFAASDEAHESNLITDYSAYIRAREGNAAIIEAVEAQFGDVFKIVTYCNTINDNPGYNPTDSSINIEQGTSLEYTVRVEGVSQRVSGVNENADTRVVPTIASQLIGTSYRENSTNPDNTIVNRSNNLTPLNADLQVSTAPTQTNTAVPITESVESTLPTAISKKQDATTVDIRTSPVASVVSTAKPEYNRDIYAQSKDSPFAVVRSAEALADTVCNTCNGVSKISLPKFSSVSLPSIPTSVRSFSISDAFTKAAVGAQKAVKAAVLSAIPKWPKASDWKGMFSGVASKLSKCNPGNRK